MPIVAAYRSNGLALSSPPGPGPGWPCASGRMTPSIVSRAFSSDPDERPADSSSNSGSSRAAFVVSGGSLSLASTNRSPDRAFVWSGSVRPTSID